MWSLHTNIIHLCTDSMPQAPRFIVHTKQQAPPWLFLSYRIWPRPFRQQRLGSPAPSNGPAAPTTRPAAALLSRAVTDGSPGPDAGFGRLLPVFSRHIRRSVLSIGLCAFSSSTRCDSSAWSLVAHRPNLRWIVSIDARRAQMTALMMDPWYRAASPLLQWVWHP